MAQTHRDRCDGIYCRNLQHVWYAYSRAVRGSRQRNEDAVEFWLEAFAIWIALRPEVREAFNRVLPLNAE